MKLFGTDGLRGKAGEFPLDAGSVRRIGRELGRRLAASNRRRAVVGGDTRESTPGILAQLAAGIREGGGEVAPAGVISTPGVAEVVLELG
ncbi:MAG TPA: phosphoglucosamine mutase, partial [Thermoanaerobaculia bacterium]